MEKHQLKVQYVNEKEGLESCQGQREGEIRRKTGKERTPLRKQEKRL